MKTDYERGYKQGYADGSTSKRDLLEALKELVDWFADDSKYAGVVMARAAIAKAEGQA